MNKLNTKERLLNRCSAASLLIAIIFSPIVYAEPDRSDYDLDNDGLIEINDLSDLDEIRNNLGGKSLYGSSEGCPDEGCSGFELTQDLDFDTNQNGKTDENDLFWNANESGIGEGWEPIGNSGTAFSAKFTGNQFEILNLHINRTEALNVGLFGRVLGSEIKGVGLVGPLTYIAGEKNVGILAGLVESNGRISQVYTSGRVEGHSNVGGLTGLMGMESEISLSFSTGVVIGNHILGGLVGSVDKNNKIISSFSTSSVRGKFQIGGLIGSLFQESIVKNSFSVGKVDGLVKIGGLIGNAYFTNRIENSYWAIDGSEQITSSRGNANTGYQGYPISVFKCYLPDRENQSENCSISASDNPLEEYKHPFENWNNELADGVSWDFGTLEQLPTLTISKILQRDSDGDGALDTYDDFQYLPEASIDQDDDGYPDRWNLSCDSDCRANSVLKIDNFPNFKEVWKDLDLDGLVDEWPVECRIECKAATGLIFDTELQDSDNDGIKNVLDSDDNGDGITDIDADSDGLIDISSLEELNAIRYNLIGSGFKKSLDSSIDYSGCPLAIVEGVYKPHCLGYELTIDLDFDSNQDGKITSEDLFWNEGKGWLPIGGIENSFSTIFEGNNFKINNLHIRQWEEECESLPNKVDAYLNHKVGNECQEYSVQSELLNTL